MIQRKPIILHTDIGTDIDDSWALIMLICQDWWDLKMVLVDTGDLLYRAALAASILRRFGKADVPIGLGIHTPQTATQAYATLADYLDGHELDHYPGGILEQGAKKLADIIGNSPCPVDLVSIGPASAIATALDASPDWAQNTRFTGMFGSICKQAEGKSGQIVEYNVKCDIPAAQKLFATPWKQMRFTPLDSCGMVRLTGDNYRAIATSGAPAPRTLMDQYRCWLGKDPAHQLSRQSSILFDTVAVHLAHSTEFLEMRDMHVAISAEGRLVEDPKAPKASAAVSWDDLPGFENHLTRTLLG